MRHSEGREGLPVPMATACTRTHKRPFPFTHSSSMAVHLQKRPHSPCLPVQPSMVVPCNAPYHGRLRLQGQTTSATCLTEFVQCVILRPAYFSHRLPNAGTLETIHSGPTPPPNASHHLCWRDTSLECNASVKNRKIRITKASVLVAGLPVRCHL